jgi:O-antigen/teichoic acid export membrane protein
MLPGTFFLALIQIVSQYLAAVGFPALQLAIWTAGFLLTCGLSIVLVPWYGGVGAAVSLSIAYTVIFLLQATLAVCLQRWTTQAVPGSPS